MDDQLFYLLSRLLDKHHIYLNKAELKLQIASHPTYPSLHAVTGVLDHFKIENLVVEVPQNEATLSQLPAHFLSVVYLDEQEAFVVTTLKRNRVVLELGDGKKKSLNTQEFLSAWQGIVLAVEKGTHSTNDGSIALLWASRIIATALGLVGLGYFFAADPGSYSWFHFTSSLLGLFLSLLIVRHELGFPSKAVNELCTGKESTSCEAVLHSKGATLFGQLKLSDLSLIFFLGLTLASYLTTVTSSEFNALRYLSLLALPITVYSLYYQKWVVQKWCPLCLGIVATLWLQAGGILLELPSFPLLLDGPGSLALLLSLSFVAVFWLLLRPLLNDQKQLGEVSLNYNHFKRNFKLFDAVFKQGHKVPPLLEDEIVLGPANAPINLTIVTNPSCFYCKEAHQHVEQMRHTYKEQLKVTVRFNIKPRDREEANGKIALRLLEMYHTPTALSLETALQEAYAEGVNPERWLSKWGEAQATAALEALIEKQYEWCAANDTNFTPAFFINERPYPEEFDRNDMIFFMDELIEQATHQGMPQMAYSH
ncbi:MAG: vitamin K epoxide reductase family protein [Salibacteraceae bacterium]